MKNYTLLLCLILVLMGCKKSVDTPPVDTIIPEENNIPNDDLSLKSILNTTWKIDSIIDNGHKINTEDYIYFNANGETLSGKISNNKLKNSRIHKYTSMDSTISVHINSIYSNLNNDRITIDKYYIYNNSKLTLDMMEIYISKVNIDLSTIEVEFDLNFPLINNSWVKYTNGNFPHHYYTFKENGKLQVITVNEFYFVDTLKEANYTIRANNNIVLSNGTVLNSGNETDTISFNYNNSILNIVHPTVNLSGLLNSSINVNYLNVDEAGFKTDYDVTAHAWESVSAFNSLDQSTVSLPSHIFHTNNGVNLKTRMMMGSIPVNNSFTISMEGNIINAPQSLFGSSQAMFKVDDNDTLFVRIPSGNLLKYVKSDVNLF